MVLWFCPWAFSGWKVELKEGAGALARGPMGEGKVLDGRGRTLPDVTCCMKSRNVHACKWKTGCTCPHSTTCRFLW